MVWYKKLFLFGSIYLSVILIANLVTGLVSFAFKLSLVTVQGPTLLSQVAMITAYYIALSVAFFLLFRYLSHRYRFTRKDFYVFFGIVVLTHALIVLFGRWDALWMVTTGTTGLAQLIYAQGGYLESLRDIPRIYYAIGLAIEDICLVVFSFSGYFKPSSKN